MQESLGQSPRPATSFEAAALRRGPQSKGAPAPFKQKQIIPSNREKGKLLDGEAPTEQTLRVSFSSSPDQNFEKSVTGVMDRSGTHRSPLLRRRVSSARSHLWQPARGAFSSRRKGALLKREKEKKDGAAASNERRHQAVGEGFAKTQSGDEGSFCVQKCAHEPTNGAGN